MSKLEPRLHIVLVCPQIPPNTGNVARLTAATGSRMHLIEPLGFSLSDKHLKRAGLDYWPSVDQQVHSDFESFLLEVQPPRERMFFFSAEAERSFREPQYRPGDFLLFGREADGLPDALRRDYADRLVSIPQDRTRVRSLNLSNTVAVASYQALGHFWK